jgi:hypothetical protein
MFTREQLIALGFDPDKAITAMNSDPSKDQVINVEPQVPFRRQEEMPIVAEAEKALATPVEAPRPVLPKAVNPQLETQSLQDRQADAMAALEVGDEQLKAQPDPLPQIPQPQQSAPKDDMLNRYMNMMDQIKREEKTATDEGRKNLESARDRDLLASTFANVAGIWGQASGGKMSGKDL